MAYWGIPYPGNTDSRYERLSGGSGNRVLLYLARRHLGMSAGEWNSTSWWEQRMLLEGLETEELITLTPLAPAATWESDPVSAPDDEYRAMGLTVITGG